MSTEQAPLASWTPPLSRFLAYLAGGRIFTQLFPAALRVVAIVLLVGFLGVWIWKWPSLYRDLERWRLVLGFLSQFVQLGAAYVLLRILFMRAQHMSEIPPGDFVTLHSFSLVVRLAAELQLVLAIGAGLQVLLAPLAGGLDRFLAGIEGVEAVALLTGGLATFGGVAAVLVVTVGVGTFFLLYTLASAVDAFVRIELNTAALADRR